MANDVAGRHYRALYAMLLRLYPRRFHDRFGEEMAQTFHDLCRERRNANRGLFGLVLWVFFETSVGAIKENTTHMTQPSKTILRVALVALGLLMVPVIASRVVDGWNWPPRAFVLVYVLFFGTGMAYALIARKMNSWAYKAGVGIALVTGFGLGWSNMVHVADSGNPANLIYYSVLVVGLIGALLTRLQPRGLAFTLFAMAALLALIAVLLPSGAPPDLARNMAIGHGISVVLLIASGLLFRRASLMG
ncbi:hypothetical protein [Terriglobus albidus]|uniref:hypothetical protein n=1 Tax=Terriglobus albidus TaxID=1592106 RepID=UPI0021DFE08A|nr:hypothetical protein [Terriglobus albidus]